MIVYNSLCKPYYIAYILLTDCIYIILIAKWVPTGFIFLWIPILLYNNLLICLSFCRHFLKLSKHKYDSKHTCNTIRDRAGKHDTFDSKCKRQ